MEFRYKLYNIIKCEYEQTFILKHIFCQYKSLINVIQIVHLVIHKLRNEKSNEILKYVKKLYRYTIQLKIYSLI